MKNIFSEMERKQGLKNMKFVCKFITAIIICLFLCSCWLPEKFTATLNIDKNKNYKFSYEGTIVFIPALEEITIKGRLTSDVESMMKEAEGLFKKEPGFKSFKYLGNGRYQVYYESSGAIQNGKKIFLDLIQFQIDKNGQIIILGPKITSKEQNKLQSIGYKLDGILKLTTKLKVVKHNAISTPKLWGLIGAYEWRITLKEPVQPMIVLQP